MTSQDEITNPLIPPEPEELPEVIQPVPFKASSTLPGTILSPGDYLVEMGSTQLIGYENLTVALAMMGWDEVMLDQSMPGHAPVESVKKNGPKPYDLWSPCEQDGELVSRFRFLARLEEPIQIQEHSKIRWLYLQGLSLDHTQEWTYKLEPHRLLKGRLYEVLFFSRIGESQRKGAAQNKTKREVLLEELQAMGWGEVLKFSALKKNIKLPTIAAFAGGSTNATITTWYAVARWAGPDGYHTEEDKLFFERVVLVEG